MKFTAEQKAAILNRLDAKRSSASAVAAALALIQELAAEGKRVSLATLYNWRRRQRLFGVRGLRDGRAYLTAAEIVEMIPPGPLRGAETLSPQKKLKILERCDQLRQLARGKNRTKQWADLTTLFELFREGIAVCHATLFNWRNRYKKAGLEGLVDHRGKNQSNKPLDRSNDRFLQEARRHRSKPNPPTMAECHRRAIWAANARSSWTTHSYKATTRYLRSIGLGEGGKDMKPAIEGPSIGHRRRF